MILNLSKLLGDKDDGIAEGESICPYMSQYHPQQGVMEKEPSLVAFTVLCVGRKCGRVLACNPDLIKKP